jgi:transcription elongation factor GreA
MTDTPSPAAAMIGALETESWDTLEEMWLESLQAETLPTADLLEVRRQLWKAGRKNLARTLLELLVESLEERGDDRGALAALADLVRLTSKPGDELIDRLTAAFTRSRKDSPSLTRVLEAHDMRRSRRPVEMLESMKTWLDHDVGTVVEVVGQGVGRVQDINLELGNVRVDIGGPRPVSVPFGAVSRYIRRLREGGYLYRKATAPDELAEFVADKPGDALAELLADFDEPADVASIKVALKGVLPDARWSAWWAKARKHPRVVSSGAGTRLRYTLSDSAQGAVDTLLAELEAVDFRERLSVARRLAARRDEGAAAAAEMLAASLTTLETTDPGLAWETAAVLATLPGGAAPATASRGRVVHDAQPLRLLAGIVDRAPRLEALRALAEERPDDWTEIWADWLLHEESAPNLDHIASQLVRAAPDHLDSALEVIFRAHLEHSAQFVWACERMTDDDAPDQLVRRMTPSVLEHLPDTLARKEFANLRSRAKALLDGGKVAIRVILERATPEQADRFAQRVGRMSVVEPQRARLVEQAAQQRKGAPEVPQSTLLVATRKAVEAKQQELKHLVEVDIPRTLKGINAAAAEGDLRENFEYHMLRDRQELQSARAAKIQRELGEVLILEPGAADMSKVNIGTVVHLAAVDGSPLEPITILGVWDADVERRIYANGAGIAQRILGKVVGDHVEIDGLEAEITAIEAWTEG